MIIGVIPARMGSTRFPGKPLAELIGKAMIYHVYFRCKMSKKMDDLYIATCDEEIRDYCLQNDMNVVMTKATHERASDRAAEAMLKIEKIKGEKVNILVMIQGDEPMIFPEMIDLSLAPFARSRSVNIVNLMGKVVSPEEQRDPNTVKVVVDLEHWALYFSREPIPSAKKFKGKIAMYKQVPIIPFRRELLLKFGRLKQTPLEIVESVDMLRLLESGYRVKMVLSEFNTHSVDTPEDLKRVEALMKKDSLARKYL